MYILFSILFATSLPIRAGWAPEAVRDSLKSLYPKVKTVGWEADGSYYVAGFQDNGFDMRVWFDGKGGWLMKQTDWETMDEVPAAVFNAFSFSPYSTAEVEDVTWVEFPHRTGLVVIQVNIRNAMATYQLFYTPSGTLTRLRNITYTYNNLGANVFL